jgi:hypothetical protein
MSEIPEDILVKARSLVYSVCGYSDNDRAKLIARAIMEERERCARIAAEHKMPNRFSVPDVWRDEQSPSEVYDTAAQDVSFWIETAILVGDNP